MKMALKKYLIRTKFQNDFGILKQSIVKVHLFKFFVYSEIVFLELTFIGSTSRHIQMTPAVMLNMIPNIKYTFCPVLNLFLPHWKDEIIFGDKNCESMVTMCHQNQFS